MKKILALLILCLSPILAVAQSEEKDTYQISTDRPSVSYSAGTLPKSIFQSEIGFIYTQADKDISSIIFPNLALRYGLNNKIELRVITDYIFTKSNLAQSEEKENGLLPLQVGTKISLIENDGLIPKVTLLGQLAIPKAASKPFKQEDASGFVKLLFENDLGNGFGLFYNAGLDFLESSTDFSYSAGLGKGVGNSSVFIEVFGAIPETGDNPFGIDAGISHSPNAKTQIDLALGIGLQNPSPDWFGTVGFSFYLD